VATTAPEAFWMVILTARSRVAVVAFWTFSVSVAVSFEA
jgi:hypothetical protein